MINAHLFAHVVPNYQLEGIYSDSLYQNKIAAYDPVKGYTFILDRGEIKDLYLKYVESAVVPTTTTTATPGNITVYISQSEASPFTIKVGGRIVTVSVGVSYTPVVLPAIGPNIVVELVDVESKEHQVIYPTEINRVDGEIINVVFKKIKSTTTTSTTTKAPEIVNVINNTGRVITIGRNNQGVSIPIGNSTLPANFVVTYVPEDVDYYINDYVGSIGTLLLSGYTLKLENKPEVTTTTTTTVAPTKTFTIKFVGKNVPYEATIGEHVYSVGQEGLVVKEIFQEHSSYAVNIGRLPIGYTLTSINGSSTFPYVFSVSRADEVIVIDIEYSENSTSTTPKPLYSYLLNNNTNEPVTFRFKNAGVEETVNGLSYTTVRTEFDTDIITTSDPCISLKTSNGEYLSGSFLVQSSPSVSIIADYKRELTSIIVHRNPEVDFNIRLDEEDFTIEAGYDTKDIQVPACPATPVRVSNIFTQATHRITSPVEFEIPRVSGQPIYVSIEQIPIPTTTTTTLPPEVTYTNTTGDVVNAGSLMFGSNGNLRVSTVIHSIPEDYEIVDSTGVVSSYPYTVTEPITIRLKEYTKTLRFASPINGYSVRLNHNNANRTVQISGALGVPTYVNQDIKFTKKTANVVLDNYRSNNSNNVITGVVVEGQNLGIPTRINLLDYSQSVIHVGTPSVNVIESTNTVKLKISNPGGGHYKLTYKLQNHLPENVIATNEREYILEVDKTLTSNGNIIVTEVVDSINSPISTKLNGAGNNLVFPKIEYLIGTQIKNYVLSTVEGILVYAPKKEVDYLVSIDGGSPILVKASLPHNTPIRIPVNSSNFTATVTAPSGYTLTTERVKAYPRVDGTIIDVNFSKNPEVIYSDGSGTSPHLVLNLLTSTDKEYQKYNLVIDKGNGPFILEDLPINEGVTDLGGIPIGNLIAGAVIRGITLKGYDGVTTYETEVTRLQGKPIYTFKFKDTPSWSITIEDLNQLSTTIRPIDGSDYNIIGTRSFIVNSPEEGSLLVKNINKVKNIYVAKGSHIYTDNLPAIIDVIEFIPKTYHNLPLTYYVNDLRIDTDNPSFDLRNSVTLNITGKYTNVSDITYTELTVYDEEMTTPKPNTVVLQITKIPREYYLDIDGNSVLIPAGTGYYEHVIPAIGGDIHIELGLGSDNTMSMPNPGPFARKSQVIVVHYTPAEDSTSTTTIGQKQVVLSFTKLPITYNLYVDGEIVTVPAGEGHHDHIISAEGGYVSIETGPGDDGSIIVMNTYVPRESATILVEYSPSFDDGEDTTTPPPGPTGPGPIEGGPQPTNLIFNVIEGVQYNVEFSDGEVITVSDFGGNTTYATWINKPGGEITINKITNLGKELVFTVNDVPTNIIVLDGTTKTIHVTEFEDTTRPPVTSEATYTYTNLSDVEVSYNNGHTFLRGQHTLPVTSITELSDEYKLLDHNYSEVSIPHNVVGNIFVGRKQLGNELTVQNTTDEETQLKITTEDSTQATINIQPRSIIAMDVGSKKLSIELVKVGDKPISNYKVVDDYSEEVTETLSDRAEPLNLYITTR